MSKASNVMAGLLLAACIGGCVMVAPRPDAPPSPAQEATQDVVKEQAGNWLWCEVFMNGC